MVKTSMGSDEKCRTDVAPQGGQSLVQPGDVVGLEGLEDVKCPRKDDMEEYYSSATEGEVE